MPMIISYWNMQEYLDSNLFWAGDSRFFGHFAFLRHNSNLPSFILHIWTAFFRVQGASFELIKHLAPFIPEKLQGLYGTLLYYGYTRAYITAIPHRANMCSVYVGTDYLSRQFSSSVHISAIFKQRNWWLQFSAQEWRNCTVVEAKCQCFACQKQNEANDKIQWYNILPTFIV